MIFTAFSDGHFDLAGLQTRCALGAGGVVEAAAKREGDGASPLGEWPLRTLRFRADRTAGPPTALPRLALAPEDGWCDAPGDPAYNRPVRHPYPASAERLWRDDHVYDLLVDLGYNDDPVIPGAGSAIFLHLARGDYAPTQGCVGLALHDLRALLTLAGPGDRLRILRV
jgi:L,D-peptidoglycan transpeptidase YkuD (ErfK/YbiS/YcfS/YnhG family)